MSLYKELSNDSNDISQIVGIQFCILSAEQIVARSVVEITKTDTYNGNEPYANGLFDARMGVIDHNKVCQTCEQRNNFCPGHFGHITLARPMFYTQFFPIVKNLLKCVCCNCSGILVNTESADIQQLLTKKISRQKRFEAIFRFSIKEKKCRHCGSAQPSLSKEGMFKIVQEWKESKGKNAAPAEDKKILAADDVLKIFRRITDKDSEILGFHKKYNRPEDLICTVFPVPPPAVRPSVRNDTGQRSEDDLSHKLAQVVKYNNMLAKKIEKEDSQVDTWSMLLQYEMATLIDNTQPGIPPSQQRTGRPIRSLIERLKGKEGRIRGNLMGKRVDFSARSVITPDPNISIDELGVPIKIAMNLTMPEVVNKWNLVKMARLVRSGPDHYPGAKYVRKTANGQERTIRLKGADRDVIADALGLGDVVERHLEDGDYVLFNRQPSLHRSSMMAHRVRVMPYNTFRLNVMVTPSFNADFDGDEMNMHVAQSLQSHEELLQLAAVPTQIISPRECKPIISVVQDIVLGLYRMTKDRVLLTRKQYFNLLAPNPRCLGDTRDPLGRGGMWTGHQLLSSIIPNKISVFMGNSQYDEEKKNDQHFIKIACGEVNQGIFDKDVYQSRTHGIIHSIYNEYGPDETRVFFDNTQQLICNWLVMDGFSVGISDLSISASTLQQFDVEISKMKTTVYDLIKNIHTGKYENNSKKNNMEDFEKQVNDKLNQAVKEVGKKGLDTIDENNNRLINMIKSKSKGQVINVSQMIGCLGQQNVDGRRIPYGFDSRTLPHYAKYDDGPEARGFVESSFIRGLTPQEFFFAAMGGREGLIDTAVQSVTGDTRVIVIENGRSKDVAIGEWIDDHLASHQTTGKIKFYPEKNMELLELPAGSVFIPTCNADGEVTWGELTHVTRHDPGTRLFKFSTESGREVIVADSKSMLVWNPDQQKLVEFESKDVCVGMSVPVTAKLPKPPGEIMTGLHDVVELTLNDPGALMGLSEDDLKSFLWNCVKSESWNEDHAGYWHVSPSRQRMEVISLLFARAGVFCEFKTGSGEHRLHIARSDWIAFAECGQVNRERDVVLDPIVSIEVMGVEHYPKLYDVTVPSTLNFALRNGLQVRDTSETGYLQRKLVKAMEDCKVGFDLSVRNAAGSIVQFLYGDDGMDASKVETQKLHYIDMQPGDIRREYLIESTEDLEHVLTAAAVKEAKGAQAAWLPKATKMYEQIVKDRDFVIAHIFKFKVESNVLYPISLARTITIAKGRMGQGPLGGSDLQPAYVLEKLEELTRSLSVNPTIPGAGMQLFHILLRAYLHPKVLICRHRLTRAAFDEVIERVRTKFYESLAHPSEMVGVIAAQSLGEPATQLSMWSGAKLMVATDRGVVYDGPIGSFIDKMLEAKENKSKVVDLGHGSVVFDPEEDYYVVGVSNEEKTSWRRILQVSRHPANGGMVRIHTASGKTTCCTLSHSFLKRVERGIEPVKGSDLKIGDRVPVAKFIPRADHGIHTVKIGEKEHVLDKDLGWLCGAYVADGHINGTQVSISKVIPEYQDNLRKIFKDKFDLTMKQYASMGSGTLQGWDMSKYPKMDNHVSSKTLADFLHSSFNTGSYRKRLPPWVFSAPQEFVAGMICGYFDGDGHVNSDLGKQMIRSASVSEELTEDFILLLTRVGIFASKCRERHFKEVGRNDLFTVQISRKYARHFKEKVGPMVVPSKAESLDKVIEYVERDDKHSSQEMIDQIPELGEVIASIGKTLELDGQSRLYGRWTKKDAIGRETLKKYLPIFELGLQDKVDRDRVQHEEATRLWSRIKARLDEFMTTDAAFMKKLGPDGKRQVNKRAVMELEEALMVPLMNACTTYLGGKYIGNGNASTYRKKQRIQAVTLDVYLTDLAKGIEEARATALAAASDVRDDKLPILRQALDADVIWDEITEIEWLPDPGEMVYDLTVPGNDSFMVDCGILVHNTLNTFHLAGVSSASKTVRGVPRLKELLSVSKNMKTPNMRIHFVEAIKYNTDACLKEMNDIRIVRFKDIVRSSQIYFDPMRKLEIDQDWLVEHEEESSLVTPWVLRLEYDPAELEKFNLHLTRDVNPFLEKQYGNLIRFYSSDDNHVIPVTRIHLQMGTQNESDLLTDLKALEHTIMEKLILKGVEGVEHVTINKEKRKIWDPLTSQFVEKEESVVYTDGTNFQRILARENVASELVYTNNVIEIYEHLGVEAARQALFNEIMIVLEAVTVNYRHIALLVDYQTNKGTLMSIDRHGINRGDIGPLAKCSFEESTDKLIKAGVFAEYDKINGVSANIMLGQITPAGTGDVTLIMDEDKLPLRPSAAPAHPNLEPTETGCDFEFDFKVPTPASF